MADAEWRTIEHTADLGLEVEAPSLEQLFVVGAHGLAGVLLGDEAGVPSASAGRATEWRELVLEGPDRQALLVDWLRELLYIQITEGVLFTAAEISELGEDRLIARAGFAPPAADTPVERELKGVTYHDLELSQRGDRWYARIVFDL
ncbi:MAG: archease [Gemmatimonadota bacterium]|nr:MAG: archease [Gemmatimonadota bacterium]